MAQQIVIDIVAETKKLTQGIDETNKQLGGMDKNIKAAVKSATALASAFVLKQGITFLKQGIDEAKDAAEAMRAATTTFGAGSAALQKITDDAEKFGKALAVDNDDIIKLATQLGSRLPKELQASSAELVKAFKDVEAFTGGAIDAEAASSKLAKAFADGGLKAGELNKIFPGLNQSIYEQAEALSKAGKNQEAVNLLLSEGAKVYQDAAAKNATSTQKFEVALANFKETLGTKVLPVLESALDFLTKLLNIFSKQPEALQNIELALLAIVGIGGPLLSFIANIKTALTTLGLFTAATEGAAIGTTLLSTALKAIPILAVIALIVLLIKNWDDVSAAAKKVWQAVNEWFGKVYEDIKDFVGKAIDWLKENWPLILGVLTGPFGLFAAWLVTHKEEVTKKLTEMWNGIKDTIGTIVELIKVTLGLKFLEMFTTVTDWVTQIKTGVVTKFNELKDGAIEQFNKLKDAASKIWDNIKEFIVDVATNIKNKLGEVYGFMVEVGKDIARGIWTGLSSMTNWFKLLLTGWVNANIPAAVRNILKISSPSKVMEEIGQFAVQGLYKGMGAQGPVGIQLPQINVGGSGAGVVININAGAGTDPYSVGRAVQQALNRYTTISK